MESEEILTNTQIDDISVKVNDLNGKHTITVLLTSFYGLRAINEEKISIVINPSINYTNSLRRLADKIDSYCIKFNKQLLLSLEKIEREKSQYSVNYYSGISDLKI